MGSIKPETLRQQLKIRLPLTLGQTPKMVLQNPNHSEIIAPITKKFVPYLNTSGMEKNPFKNRVVPVLAVNPTNTKEVPK